MIWFHKILELIFQKQPSCPRKLNIEENHPFSQLSWKFSYTFRKTIPQNTCKKFSSFYFLKCNRNFLRVKICQIPHVILESTSQFTFKFYQSSVASNITVLYFFSSNIWTLVKRRPLKCKFLKLFECSGLNSSDSSSQF